jgi:hypothetical protein
MSGQALRFVPLKRGKGSQHLLLGVAVLPVISTIRNTMASFLPRVVASLLLIVSPSSDAYWLRLFVLQAKD